MSYDIAIWEQIRSAVEWRTRTLVQDVIAEISEDGSLRDLQGIYPVPWQLREVMRQRADSWIQRLYEPCCHVYQNAGKKVSAEFDQSVWAYWIAPFITREVQVNAFGYRASMLLELLLCAVGSPPEQRNLLKLAQKQCCVAVRTTIYETWYDKLHHLPPRINEASAAMARFNATEARAARLATRLPSEPSPLLPTARSVETQPSTPPQPAVASTPASVPEPQAEPALVVSKEQQSGVRRADVLVQSKGAGTANWESIEISFLSDERIQIRNGRTTETRNYAEFGFADHRSGNPIQAWILLRVMAERRGIIREGKDAGQKWPKVEKGIQKIRMLLRSHFGNPSDPIPFIEGTGYQARFKISCAPSYRT